MRSAPGVGLDTCGIRHLAPSKSDTCRMKSRFLHLYSATDKLIVSFDGGCVIPNRHFTVENWF